MGKSRRKTPIFSNGGGSEKDDKRIANRKLRRKSKSLLKNFHENIIMPIIREVSNVWLMNKDGKHYWGDVSKKDMRK